MANDEMRDEVQPKDAGRRALLKAATVAGGAVAASALLPGSWKKPVATIGGLPAHAQMSQTITITDAVASYQGWPVSPPNDVRMDVTVPEPDIGVYCKYVDTLGDFDLDHEVTFRVNALLNGSASDYAGGCGQSFTYKISDLFSGQQSGFWEGDKFQGELWLAVFGNCCPPDGIAMYLHGAGHQSNEVVVKVDFEGGCSTPE